MFERASSCCGAVLAGFASTAAMTCARPPSAAPSAARRRVPANAADRHGGSGRTVECRARSPCRPLIGITLCHRRDRLRRLQDPSPQVARLAFPCGPRALLEERSEEAVQRAAQVAQERNPLFEQHARGFGFLHVRQLRGVAAERLGVERERILVAGLLEDHAGLARELAGADGVAGFGHAGRAVAAEGVLAGMAVGAVEVEGAVDENGQFAGALRLDRAVAHFGLMPEPQEELVADEVLRLEALGDPRVLGVLALAFGA